MVPAQVASTPRWSTVLFDLDGTLINSIPLIIESFQHTFDHFTDASPPVGEIRSWIGLTLEDTFAPFAGANIQEWVQVYRGYNRALHDERVSAFAGMPELVNDLLSTGCVAGVVTAKYPDLAQRGLVLTGFPTLDPLIGNGDVLRNKPAPDPILKAMELAKAEPHTTVYIGDAGTDILAGQAAGVDTIGVTWGAGERAQLDTAAPTQIATSVAELRAMLLS